jgi:hypothetical protein
MFNPFAFGADQEKVSVALPAVKVIAPTAAGFPPKGKILP